MKSRRRTLFLGTGLLLGGCLANLDGFLHNPRHCSVVGPETCEEVEAELDRACTPCDTPYDWQSVNIPSERVSKLDIQLADGVTNDAYYIEGDGELRDQLLVYSHGNYASIDHYRHHIGWIYPSGVSLFVYEYRGYGKSSGKQVPTESEFFADAEAALEVARSEHQARGRSADDISLFGTSLGGIPTMHLAQIIEARRLILEAPYPSSQMFFEDSTGTSLPSTLLLEGRYDNEAAMRKVDTPLLLIHSPDDTKIRIGLSQRLYDASPADTRCFWRVPGAAHGVDEGIPLVLGIDVFAEGLAEFMRSEACPAQP